MSRALEQHRARLAEQAREAAVRDFRAAPYTEGFTARLRGDTFASNPYLVQTREVTFPTERAQWAAGWRAANSQLNGNELLESSKET